MYSGRVFEGVIISCDDSSFRMKSKEETYVVPYSLVQRIEASDDKRAVNSEYLDKIIEKIDKINERRRQRDLALKERIKNKKVEFYMAPWCPYCRKMEAFLNDIEANYESFNVELDSAASRRYKSLGGKGIPFIRIGNEIIKGYDTEAVWAVLTR